MSLATGGCQEVSKMLLTGQYVCVSRDLLISPHTVIQNSCQVNLTRLVCWIIHIAYKTLHILLEKLLECAKLNNLLTCFNTYWH